MHPNNPYPMSNDEETKVTPDTSEQEEVEVKEPEDVQVTEPEDVQVTEPEDEPEPTDWEAKAKKAEQVAGNYKKRAEKAEKKVKDLSPDAQKVELSQLDILAIAKADVHQDDLSVVTKYVEELGSADKALSNDDLKAILERRAEARRAAAASDTGGSAPANNQVSPDTMLANARNGDMPDPKDLDAFFDAEKKGKK